MQIQVRRPVDVDGPFPHHTGDLSVSAQSDRDADGGDRVAGIVCLCVCLVLSPVMMTARGSSPSFCLLSLCFSSTWIDWCRKVPIVH